MSRTVLLLALAAFPGCQLIPDVSHQPVLHNPFPQLSRVAVAPFVNLSDEPTVDGREFAIAYFAQLQEVPGFEVVPVTVVEEAILQHRVMLDRPGEARRLAELLGVDAVVVGAVTDYDPYYPPRVGMRVEWYAANQGFHEIPPGYGLPWGTSQEEFIPEPLVFEAEFALAKAQLATQTPDCGRTTPDLQAPPPADGVVPPPPADPFSEDQSQETDGDAVQTASHECAVEAGCESPACRPPGWPDPGGFTPPPPSCVRPACIPCNKPVMTHTQIYRGTDPAFTQALEGYFHFSDDARFGGWQAYLQRSDDLINFCCHLHISEMLSARGGAGETRVVWRWSDRR